MMMMLRACWCTWMVRFYIKANCAAASANENVKRKIECIKEKVKKKKEQILWKRTLIGMVLRKGDIRMNYLFQYSERWFSIHKINCKSIAGQKPFLTASVMTATVLSFIKSYQQIYLCIQSSLTACVNYLAIFNQPFAPSFVLSSYCVLSTSIFLTLYFLMIFPIQHLFSDPYLILFLMVMP